MPGCRFLPLLALSVALTGCATAPAPETTATAQPATAPPAAGSAPAARATGAMPSPGVPRLLNVSAAQTPEAGKVATTVLQESATNVARIMRLAAGAVIPEHHHPAHDETFLVHQGSVTAALNGVEHVLKSGDVVVIPAGTVIVGRNGGADEAVVVVVFSANGRGGPLTVPGRPTH